MEARYLTWNFANFMSVNLIVAVGVAVVVLAMKLRKGPAQAGA